MNEEAGDESYLWWVQHENCIILKKVALKTVSLENLYISAINNVTLLPQQLTSQYWKVQH